MIQRTEYFKIKKTLCTPSVASNWMTENSFAICECITAEQRDNKTEKLPTNEKEKQQQQKTPNKANRI